MGYVMLPSLWLKTGTDTPFDQSHTHEYLRQVIDTKIMESYRRAHRSGQSEYTDILHSFYFLNKWFNKWCD